MLGEAVKKLSPTNYSHANAPSYKAMHYEISSATAKKITYIKEFCPDKLARLIH